METVQPLWWPWKTKCWFFPTIQSASVLSQLGATCWCGLSAACWGDIGSQLPPALLLQTGSARETRLYLTASHSLKKWHLQSFSDVLLAAFSHQTTRLVPRRCSWDCFWIKTSCSVHKVVHILQSGRLPSSRRALCCRWKQDVSSEGM